MKKIFFTIIYILLIQSFSFADEFDILTENFCFKSQTEFSIYTSVNIDSVLWNFGEPTSTSNTSKLLNTNHQYNTTGVFSVSVEIFYQDTLYQEIENLITIFSLPNVDLPDEAVFCANKTITLDASYPNANYLWHDGSTLSSFTTNEAGVCSVIITDVNNCSSTYSVNLSKLEPPHINLPNDTAVCSGDMITLDASYPNANYLWHNGSTSSSLTTNEIGICWVQVIDANNCMSIKSINLFRVEKPTVNLGEDLIICANEITLNSGLGFDSYQWSNGSNESIITVTKSGQYIIEVGNTYCLNSDTINLTLKPTPVLDELDISINREIHVYASNGLGTLQYILEDDKLDTIMQTNGDFYDLGYGNYKITIVGENDCRTFTSMFKTIDSDIYVKIPSAFTPNGDGINDKWIIDHIGFYPSAEIFIFDRFGKLIVKYKGNYEGWDGNYNYKKIHSGTYWYKIDLKNKTPIRFGSVTLIR